MVPELPALRVVLSGEYDISRTAELRDAILARHDGEPAIVVDLTDVTFIDSSGLRALLEVRSVLSAAGACLTVADPTDNVRRLVMITGMTELLGLGPTPSK